MSVLVVHSQAQSRRRTPKRSHAAPTQAVVNLPPATVLKLNDDGSYQIEISGQRFRALTGKQLDDWAKMEIDLRGAQQKNENLQADNKELEGELATRTHELGEEQKKFIASEAKVTSLTLDFERAREDAKRNFGLFMGERQLRTEAQQFIPHGEVKGFGGFILKALDGPYGQAAFKLVIPSAQFLKVMSQGCK